MGGCGSNFPNGRPPSIIPVMTTPRLTRLTTADAAAASAVYNLGYLQHAANPVTFAQGVARLERDGGGGWVLHNGRALVAVVTLASVPGLPGLFDLELAVDPPLRRQGWGSRTLQLLLPRLQGGPVRQIACGVDDLAEPAARFLFANGFSVEHEEWILLRPDLDHLPAVDPALAGRVDQLPWATAVATFLTLYDDAFAGTAWYQPFSHAELSATLDSAGDLLFLFDGERPIGLAWLRLEDDHTGVIEPFGIVGPEQRKGYGRGLLTIALHALRRRGARRARIGAWHTNTPALQLYRSLGFQHAETRIYLARSVS